ncbi:ubiquitin carboxyl-terminal hydrolase 48-like isoform X2 [Toxotes jaculatrix]|uniref:ubiquitin carboxyl-terminal hydrolase 48-like isoform X2 n=1 Tax=Toxotes jaculatrix TaxID=941984 RepID=UPI001B3AD4B9|nr:ubiquitin carboxyl-terminal hydrolase 48-like isoform X2 [Toxotes jaculatrix]
MGGIDDSKNAANKYHGLRNQGATCYLNSVLQVLFMTKDFREAVESFISENPEAKGIDPDLKALFAALRKTIAHTLKITKALGINRVFEQRDAAEYLEKILNHTSPEASWIFQGVLTHKNICCACETEVNTDGPFWNLPLPLVKPDNEDYYNVMDGIKRFFRPSKATGDNQLYCDKCDAKADATTKFVVKHHPEVLTLLLKRFKFDFRRMENVKITCSVEVPYTLQIPENQTYELYGYVEHFGSLKGGHYTATVRSQDDNEWYNFNDTSVRRLDYKPFQEDNKNKSETAYLLFYRKKTNQKPAANTLTPDIGEASTPEHQEDKQEHYSHKPEADKENVAADVKVKEDSETGANESEQAAGSGELLTSSDYERQDSRTAGDSEHNMPKTDQETEEGQSSGEVNGLVENKEDVETEKLKAKKNIDIQPSKPNDQECEGKVEEMGEEKMECKGDGEGAADQDNGLLNVSQNGHEDVSVERQIIEQDKTGDNERTLNRDEPFESNAEKVAEESDTQTGDVSEQMGENKKKGKKQKKSKKKKEKKQKKSEKKEKKQKKSEMNKDKKHKEKKKKSGEKCWTCVSKSKTLDSDSD